MDFPQRRSFVRFFRPGEDPTHQLCTRCPRTFWSRVSFEIFERCFMIFFWTLVTFSDDFQFSAGFVHRILSVFSGIPEVSFEETMQAGSQRLLSKLQSSFKVEKYHDPKGIEWPRSWAKVEGGKKSIHMQQAWAMKNKYKHIKTVIFDIYKTSENHIKTYNARLAQSQFSLHDFGVGASVESARPCFRTLQTWSRPISYTASGLKSHGRRHVLWMFLYLL